MWMGEAEKAGMGDERPRGGPRTGGRKADTWMWARSTVGVGGGVAALGREEGGGKRIIKRIEI
jgi:hypothetical protein